MPDNTNMGITFITLFAILFPSWIIAQNASQDWYLHSDKSLTPKDANMFVSLPTEYITGQIDSKRFYSKMKNTPQEIELPNPSGTFDTYVVAPSQVNAPEVAHLYTIKTFTGYLKSDSNIKIACDISPMGFNAFVYAGEKSIVIGPISNKTSSEHIIYYRKNHSPTKVGCLVTEWTEQLATLSQQKSFSLTQKKTYRLAVSASGEYGTQFGGTPYNITNVLNAIASGINMINPIYLRDLGISFTNVTTAAAIFHDPATDPYFRPDGASSDWGVHSIDQLATTLDSALGNATYQVGHLVVWDDIGGLGGPAPCNQRFQAGGFSGEVASVTTLWVDLVAHEIGHQFGMPHNFSNHCNGYSNNNFRFEPGEGSSIMSYANVCGVGYAQATDPYFAVTSINAAQPYIDTHTCPNRNGAGNFHSPVIGTLNNITVPKSTPFILVGSATDDNDPQENLTYAWEQNDGNGPATIGPPTGTSTTEPLFRFRPATSDNFRHFPPFTSSLAGINSETWDQPSSVARTINFSLTVRDNNAAFGRIGQGVNVITVANTGPFSVTFPNGGETLTETTTVTWTVNGTNTHCPLVDILVSTDGGTSFEVVSDATANDGSQLISLPPGNFSSARVLVRCNVPGGFRAASTFYDVSDDNFNLKAACTDNITIQAGNTTGTTSASMSITTQGNVNANGALFSAPMVTMNVGFCVPQAQLLEVNTLGCGN